MTEHSLSRRRNEECQLCPGLDGKPGPCDRRIEEMRNRGSSLTMNWGDRREDALMASQIIVTCPSCGLQATVWEDRKPALLERWRREHERMSTQQKATA